MAIRPPIPDNEARQAVDALAGYAYQLYQTFLAWFALQPGEVLFVEVAEDYAVATGTTLSAAQIRATAANITLRTSHVAEALNAYWALRQNNPGRRVTYRYLTTSGIGKEQGLQFPDGLTGFQYWRRAATPGSDVQPVRNALLTLELSDELHAFVETVSDDDLRAHLLAPVHWDCGEADLAQVKEMAALQSAWRATKIAQATAAEGKSLVDPLIARLLSVACEKTTRQLTSVDLDEFIQQRLMVQVPRRALAALLGAGHPTEPTTNLGIAIDASAVPFPEPLLDRPNLVAELSANTSRGGLLFIQGSSGKGKSTLARLLARQIGGEWSIIDLRGLEPSQVNSRLLLVASTAAAAKASVILDDLPIEQDANIERSLAVVTATLRAQDKLLIATTSNKPSSRVRSLVGVADSLVIEMPNLSLGEVSALVEKLGGDGNLWGAITQTVCGGGHPQLVVARLRRLSRQDWPKAELLGGIDPKTPAGEIDDERTATRKRLYAELDNSSRTLIDRLSIVGNRFDRRMALAIGGEPPPVTNTGDALTQLTGPWIEQLERGHLRLSPLLAGSAKDNLTAEQARRISICIVNDIMTRNPIEGSLISVAFVHALASHYDAALARIATLPTTMEGEKKRYVAEQLFALEVLRTDRPIRPENPHVSVMLRQSQFQVCAERGSWDLAETVATQLMAEINLIPKDQMRDEMKALAISTILCEPRLPKNPAGWFEYLVELIHLLASVKGPLGDEIRKGAERFQLESGYALTQLLFALAATRRSSVAELEALFTRLDGVQPEIRNQFLSAFDAGPGDIKLLISNAWLGDHERDALDGSSAAQRYEKLARLADNWTAIKPAIECEVARSIMLDEYALDPQAALDVLDEAEQRYGARLELARQRAKVLHRKGDHAASLEVIRAIGDQLDPKDLVERAFAFRSAGISAAELRDWEESVRFFAKAREAALGATGDLASMAIGLLGDMAASQTRVGNTKAALVLMNQALEELQKFEPPTTDAQLYTRHLLGHVPTWMEQELFPSAVRQEFAALAPGKCSQPDPIPAILERALYPIDVCWYQLARVERRTDQDVGIRAAIRAWPDTHKMLSLEGLLTNEDTAYFMRNRRLAQFKEAILDEVSSLLQLADRRVELRSQNFNTATRGTFTRLPLADIETGEAPVVISTAVVGYALSCILSGDSAAYDELVTLRDADLANHSAFKRVMPVLSGKEKPSGDATLEIAGYIAQLRGGEDALTPAQLFVIQCQLLAWLRNALVGEALAINFAAWVCRTWRRIIEEESFRLRQPAATAPAIEAEIANPDRWGRDKAASVLLVADEATGSRLSLDFRKFVADMAKAGT